MYQKDEILQSTDKLPQNVQSISNSILFREVSPSHIENIISSLKKKTCHIMSYPAEVLKFLRHIISPALSLLVKKLLNLGICLNSVKTARVIPLFKSGATTNLTYYPPYSVLPLLSEVFERVVHNQLLFFLKNINYSVRVSTASDQENLHLWQGWIS